MVAPRAVTSNSSLLSPTRPFRKRTRPGRRMACQETAASGLSCQAPAATGKPRRAVTASSAAFNWVSALTCQMGLRISSISALFDLGAHWVGVCLASQRTWRLPVGFDHSVTCRERVEMVTVLLPYFQISYPAAGYLSIRDGVP